MNTEGGVGAKETYTQTSLILLQPPPQPNPLPPQVFRKPSFLWSGAPKLGGFFKPVSLGNCIFVSITFVFLLLICLHPLNN